MSDITDFPMPTRYNQSTASISFDYIAKGELYSTTAVYTSS